jgi:hypothetical protein
VRLPAEFARQLYSLTRPGDIVVISADDTPVALQRAGVDNRVGPLVGVPDLPPRREGPLVPDGALAPAIASEAGGANGVTAY